MSTAAEEPEERESGDHPDRGGAREQGSAHEFRAERPAAGRAAYDGNRQRVTGNGFAFMGEARDIHFHALLDEADDRILVPRFREGPYPAAEIENRLRVFIEPTSYLPCRKSLERGLLLLRGAGGSGAVTAAFALLRDQFGAGNITGLDPALDLTRWSPTAARGYVIQGLSPEAADALNGNALIALADDLRQAGAALVVVLGEGRHLPRDTWSWQVLHVPPNAYDVARGCLSSMVREGELPAELLETALAYLAESRLADYLGTGQPPAVAVDVATELRAVAVGERSMDDAVGNLRLGGAKAAQETLDTVRGSAEGLAFAAAVALLEYQDRTVIHQYAGHVRDRLAERYGQSVALSTPPSTGTEQRDLLGCSFEDRLADVRARLLPRQVVRRNGSRYWSQPVAFQGQHQADFVLRRLWWDYDGIAEVLWTGLRDMPYQSGADLAAGRALGRVLCHSTGRPQWLRPLYDFAASDYRWHRRLAAYALGEIAQDPDLVSAVRAQLREWSRRRNVFVRCTVAEACAGSFGLSSPTAAMNLLDAILNGADDELTANLRNTVSFALRVLLAEETNRPAVLAQLTGWLAQPVGTLRRAFAVHAVTTLSGSAAGGQYRSSGLGLSLTDLVTAPQDGLLPLVTAALENPASHGAMAEALTVVARSPDSRQRAAAAELLACLSDASPGRPGVVAFLLARYRARTASGTSERTRP